MADLIVLGYPDAAKAEAAREDLLAMQKEYLVRMSDAVVATRDAKGRVRLNQLVHPWTFGAATGSIWGLVIGLFFLNPLFGIVLGAAAGAVGGAMTDYGIDDAFMKRTSEMLSPGQAALFFMAERATGDRVVEHLARHGGTVLRTNLDSSQEQKLRAAFDAAQRDLRGTPAAA